MRLFVQKRRFWIMAEFSNSNTVSVAAGENLPLTETAVKALRALCTVRAAAL